jgi:hypothetical protein
MAGPQFFLHHRSSGRGAAREHPPHEERLSRTRRGDRRCLSSEPCAVRPCSLSMCDSGPLPFARAVSFGSFAVCARETLRNARAQGLRGLVLRAGPQQEQASAKARDREGKPHPNQPTDVRKALLPPRADERSPHSSEMHERREVLCGDAGPRLLSLRHYAIASPWPVLCFRTSSKSST